MVHTARCPDCHDLVRLTRSPRLGQRMPCPLCRARLEVINLEPTELDWAFESALVDASDEILDPSAESLA